MENKILATVNGREITEMDLRHTIARFPKERQGYFSSENGRKQLLEQIISFELIHNFAKDSGFDADEAYTAQLGSVKKEILTQYAINKVLSEVRVSDDEIKDYYKDNQPMFLSEESVSAKHILVDTEEEASNIVKEIENGLSFEEAASKYSKCPSKANGGDLGVFTKGKMVPEFEKAAFELGVGVVSAPVQTQFGYHIIKVEEKNEASVKTFEEVEGTIRNNILQEKQNEKYMKMTEELKDKYAVVIK